MPDLWHGDCLEILRYIPDHSVDLVLTDPHYNIGLTSVKDNKSVRHDWDKIDNYLDWMIAWLLECQRVLAENGVLYLWHNDMVQIAELMQAIKDKTKLQFLQFCIWDKGTTYRAQAWVHRDPDGNTSLRTWFNRCEYCLHYCIGATDKPGDTGLERILSDPALFGSIKTWYQAEMTRLGLTYRDIARKYTQATGRKPYMLHHYFQASQFEIPTAEVWEAVYAPLGFAVPFGAGGYEGLRQEYEGLRYYHRCDPMHSNVWQVPQVPTTNRLHPCQKPVEILERLVRVSCKPGGVVLDPFMGSGSTGVACVRTGRNFIGIERDADYFATAQKRLAEAVEIKELEDAQTTIGGM